MSIYMIRSFRQKSMARLNIRIQLAIEITLMEMLIRIKTNCHDKSTGQD